MEPYNLNLQESPALLVINTILMTVTLFATLASATILGLTIRKRDHYFSVDDSPLAKLTFRRALRNESAYVLCHVILLVLSVWSLSKVMPSAPAQAIQYYFATQVGRTAISLILIAATGFDLWNRTEIAREIRRQESK